MSRMGPATCEPARSNGCSATFRRRGSTRCSRTPSRTSPAAWPLGWTSTPRSAERSAGDGEVRTQAGHGARDPPPGLALPPGCLLLRRCRRRRVFHRRHAQSTAGCVETGHDNDIEHHAGVLVVEDVAVDDELADISVVPCPDMHLVIILDNDRITEDVVHPAILVGQVLLVAADVSAVTG